MTTKQQSLADAFEAWRGRTFTVETGVQTFDALVSRVRELEAELVLANTREQDAYESVVENYRAYVEEQAICIEALQGQVDRLRELEQFWAEDVTRIEHWQRIAAEAQEHLAAALVREQALIEDKLEAAKWSVHRANDAWHKALVSARRKALEEALEACYDEFDASVERIRELFEREPKP